MVTVGNQKIWITELKTLKKMKILTHDLKKPYVCAGLAHKVSTSGMMCNEPSFIPSLFRQHWWCRASLAWDLGWALWYPSIPDAKNASTLAECLPKSSCSLHRGWPEVPKPPPMGELDTPSSYQTDACRHLWRVSVQKRKIPATM